MADLKDFEESRTSSFGTEGLQMVYGEIEALTEERSHAGNVFPEVLKTEHWLSVTRDRNSARHGVTVKGLPTMAKSLTEPNATSSDAEAVPQSIAKDWEDEMHGGGSVAKTRADHNGMHLAAVAAAAVDTRGPRVEHARAWKANCATLDEKATAVTKHLDEKVVAISRQMGGKRRPSPQSSCKLGKRTATSFAQQEFDSERVLGSWKESSIRRSSNRTTSSRVWRRQGLR